MSPYVIHIISLIAIYVLFAWSLNLAMGYTGLIHLGIVAFFGVGAYASVLVDRYLHTGYWAAVLVGMVSTVPLSILLSMLTKRVHGDYLALMTLWFSFVCYEAELNWTSLTHGPLGITGIQRPILFNDPVHYAALLVFIAVVVWFILTNILRGPFGRLCAAIRDDEIAAVVIGKNTDRVKRVMFMSAGMLAGLAGACFAYFLRFIDPSSFYLPELVIVLTMAVVGGLGTLEGTTLAVIVLVGITEGVRFIPMTAEYIGAIRQLVYAIVLLAILVWRPKGFLGKVTL